LYREFIRKNFLKKKVKWSIIGEVILSTTNENLTEIVIKNGYGKVKGKNENLKKLQTEAMKNKLGLFCNENSIRFLPDVVLKKDHLDSILQKYSDKPTIGIVELVINASLYKVTLVNENVQVFIILDGVQGWGTDNNYNFIITDDQYKLAYKYILSKKLAEFNVLSREVGIKFVGKDKSNNLIAQIF